MAVHWKSKQTQRNLLGKSTLTYQANQLSPIIHYIGEEVVWVPPSFPASLFYGDSYGNTPYYAVTQKVSHRFTCRENINVDRIGICMVFTSGSMTVGIQKDDGTGKPDGTWLTSATVSGALAKDAWMITVPSVSLEKAKVYHVVLEPISAPDGFAVYWTNPNPKVYPYDSLSDTQFARLVYSAGTWSIDTDRAPLFLIGNSTSNIFYGQPFNQLTNGDVYASYYTGEEWTQIGTASFTKVKVRVYKIGSPPNNLLLSIYNKTDSAYVLQDFIIGTTAEIPTTPTWVEKTLPSPITLTNGKVYQLFLRTVGGDSSNFYRTWILLAETAGTWAGWRNTETWNGTAGKAVWTTNGTVPLQYSDNNEDISFQLIE